VNLGGHSGIKLLSYIKVENVYRDAPYPVARPIVCSPAATRLRISFTRIGPEVGKPFGIEMSSIFPCLDPENWRIRHGSGRNVALWPIELSGIRPPGPLGAGLRSVPPSDPEAHALSSALHEQLGLRQKSTECPIESLSEVTSMAKLSPSSTSVSARIFGEAFIA
jgi:hypothetical protein